VCRRASTPGKISVTTRVFTTEFEENSDGVQGFEGMLMDKIDVNGKAASDVYNFLKVKSGQTGSIKWNFTKVGPMHVPVCLRAAPGASGMRLRGVGSSICSSPQRVSAEHLHVGQRHLCCRTTT